MEKNTDRKRIAFSKVEEALGFDVALEIATDLGSISRKRARLLQKVQRVDIGLPMIEGKFDNVAELIEAAVASQRFIPWAKAYATLFEGPFQSVRCPQVVAAFEAVINGASALIVDSKGYQAKKVAEHHRDWLASYGYEAFPGVK